MRSCAGLGIDPNHFAAIIFFASNPRSICRRFLFFYALQLACETRPLSAIRVTANRTQ